MSHPVVERLSPAANGCLLTCQQPHPSLAVREWGGTPSARLRTLLTGEVILVVWLSRESGGKYRVCDGVDACRTETLTFITGGPHDVDGLRAGVPDMTEALRLIGMLASVLDARGEGKALCPGEETV